MNKDENSDGDDLVCPITLEIFRDPVLATDGHVYERQAITRWIQQHETSPFTREILRVEDLCSDKHLKKLAAQRRNSTVIYTADKETIKFPLRCFSSRNQHKATVHPPESLRTGRVTTRNSHCESKIWIAILLMMFVMVVVLSVTFFLILTRNALSKRIKTSSANVPNSCLFSSRSITLLNLTDATPFNYTYYSYSYKAMSSNDTILFSFRHDSSSWCFDDLSIINVNSRAKLIINGGFESGFLTPFYFCSQYGDSTTTLSSGNSSQRSGVYAFCYRSISYIDYLSQSLNTTKGQIYNVSFWIKNRGDPQNILTVTIIA